MAAGIVYALVALAALGCALLLLRGYARTGTRLLLWGGLCFLALTANNVLVFADVMIVPQFDLYTWRNVAALVGISLFLYGLIWDAD